MEIIGNMFDFIKNMRDLALPRKSRIIRYVACVIVIFVYFNWKYWDILAYIDVPSAPLFPNPIVKIDFKFVILSSIIFEMLKCVVRNTAVKKLQELYPYKKVTINYFFIESIADFFLSIIWLAGSLNMIIGYAHGFRPKGYCYFVVSFVYLFVCILSKEHVLFMNKFAE